MQSFYDKELYSYFEREQLLSQIKISDTADEIISQLEQKFNFGYSGIKWNEQNILLSQKISAKEETNIMYFLSGVIKLFPSLHQEVAFLVGDNLTELVYEMNFSVFLNCYEVFLLIPQHTYIWFPESQRCINFTFEDEVYFG